GEFFKSKHVHNANNRQRDTVKIGALRHAPSNEQSAVAAAADREFRRRRVFVVDQVLGRGDEIIEDVLFDVQHSGFVPFLAVLAATAQVGQRVNAAHFHPNQVGRREGGGARNIESTVTV